MSKTSNPLQRIVDHFNNALNHFDLDAQQQCEVIEIIFKLYEFDQFWSLEENRKKMSFVNIAYYITGLHKCISELLDSCGLDLDVDYALTAYLDYY